MPRSPEEIAAQFPEATHDRGFIADVLWLRQRESSYPFREKQLDMVQTALVGQAVESPEAFWSLQGQLSRLQVAPDQTFLDFLKQTAWDGVATPTRDHLRESLQRAANANRSASQRPSSIIVE